MEKKWFVFYTKSRQEKKVNELLLKRGFEPFLPMQAIVRQWSDRKKKVVLPLFNAYMGNSKNLCFLHLNQSLPPCR